MEQVLRQHEGRTVRIMTVTGTMPLLPADGRGEVVEALGGVLTFKPLGFLREMYIAIEHIVWFTPEG